MSYHSANKHLLFLGIIIACLLAACSNSEYTGWDDIIVSQDSNGSADSSKLDYLPLDDSEYPYAGIPRIVIVTENYREIKDRETEIPAKLQIWGEKAPESEIMDLTIRGRGNTSWEMPKKSYKIEFINKQSMLGMPKDRDWALIANYADKTLMRNYLMYHLSADLGAYYAPRCEFVEFYLNNEYLGVYLLTETIKIAKKRVNIPQNDESYLVEFDTKYRETEQIFFSKIIRNDAAGKPFRIHSPKNATSEILSAIETHITKFESFLKETTPQDNNHLEQWIDIDEYIKHYWVQEFSKNTDANFYTSVYFSWIKNGVIRIGPVWDFDLAFGNHFSEHKNTPDSWIIKDAYWNFYIFKDSIMEQERVLYWTLNRDAFISSLDRIDSIYSILYKPAKNNFKKWDILTNSYKEVIEQFKIWILSRIDWIDKNIQKKDSSI